MKVIADIAGQYDALMRLVRRFDDETNIVLVGDLIDRGPKSRQVIEWAMNDPRVLALKGNHEDMMIDAYERIVNPDYESPYASDDWYSNGGLSTLRSYDIEAHDFRRILANVPITHINWLKKMPIETEFWLHGFIIYVSHAAKLQNPMATAFDKIWNREEPKEIPAARQVFGHNSHWGLRAFGNEDGPWAVCIDQSARNILTGFDPETLEVYEEPYEVKREADLTL